MGQRDAGRGQLGRDAERVGAEARQHDARMVTDTQPKICIYPGCERPAVPPHPMGGPQPAFCDLEEHNALSAHLERKRLAGLEAATTNRGELMAGEAYRAVFIRDSPDRQDGSQPDHRGRRARGRIRATGRDELGVPALDVKVVPADTDRFGERPRLQHEPVRRDARRRSRRRRARSSTKARLLAGMAMGPRRTSCSGRTALRRRTASSRRRSPTSRCYSYGSGELPARGSRAGSTRRPSTATDLTVLRISPTHTSGRCAGNL